jgi:hypothetical protein
MRHESRISHDPTGKHLWKPRTTEKEEVSRKQHAKSWE